MITRDIFTYLLQRLGGPYPLYTTPPQCVNYPYISLEILQVKHEAKNNRMKIKAYLQIQAWSRASNPTEIQDMSSHIHDLLSDQLLRIDGLGMASCRVLEDSTKILNDRATRLYHTKLIMGIRQ